MLYNAAQSRILQSGSSKHHWSDLTYRQGSSPGNRNTHHGHASNIVRSRAGQPAHVQPRKTNERVWINNKFSSYNLRVKVQKVINVHNQSRTIGIFTHADGGHSSPSQHAGKLDGSPYFFLILRQKKSKSYHQVNFKVERRST